MHMLRNPKIAFWFWCGPQCSAERDPKTAHDLHIIKVQKSWSRNLAERKMSPVRTQERTAA